MECDIDNPESNNIKEREYDLDHDLLIKNNDNFMLKYISFHSVSFVFSFGRRKYSSQIAHHE